MLQTNLKELFADATPEEIFHKLGVLSLFMHLFGPCC